jgi:hypothetical protein
MGIKELHREVFLDHNPEYPVQDVNVAKRLCRQYGCLP